jgi:HEAT repeat protein
LLEALLTDDSPLVRAHAAWGLMQVDSTAADAVAAAAQREPDADARADMQQTLDDSKL